MPNTPLSKKLLIKPGYKVLLINSPEGYREEFGETPAVNDTWSAMRFKSLISKLLDCY